MSSVNVVFEKLEEWLLPLKFGTCIILSLDEKGNNFSQAHWEPGGLFLLCLGLKGSPWSSELITHLSEAIITRIRNPYHFLKTCFVSNQHECYFHFLKTQFIHFLNVNISITL